MATELQAFSVEPPRGLYPARVDDKGRLKLPVEFQKFLAQFGEEKYFVTSFDARIARIYPLSVWKENEIFLGRNGDQRQTLEDLHYMSQFYGSDSKLDEQGRVLMPPVLRREMGVENQPVYVECYCGRINVFSEQVHGERLARARAALADKLAAAEMTGLR